MSFEKAWLKAQEGQILKHHTGFCIVKGFSMTLDACLAIKSTLPLTEGWDIDRSGIKVEAKYEAIS